MNGIRGKSKVLSAALLLAFGLTACTTGNDNKLTARDTGAYDMDSRNNENATLGAKSLPQTGDRLPMHDSVDKTEFHYNSRLDMNQAMADRLLAQFPDLSAAYVALTESNVYAAVKLKQQGSEPGASALSAEPMPDGITGAGIFGNGQGHMLDWRDHSGLTTEMQTRISTTVHSMVPGKANIFVSSNPNYVNRMRYYSEQARTGRSMDNFINEFNTMVHYVFPNNTNASNKGIR
jgi:YhcN/YlaJ family sporulation lipoprotein